MTVRYDQQCVIVNKKNVMSHVIVQWQYSYGILIGLRLKSGDLLQKIQRSEKFKVFGFKNWLIAWSGLFTLPNTDSDHNPGKDIKPSVPESVSDNINKPK